MLWYTYVVGYPSFVTRHYITTAIDYPNAAPHMGHVLEKVLADVMARWQRLNDNEVRFQIGTDEHGIKIQRTAEAEDVSPKELVDRNVVLFEDLYEKLNISHDYFIRTSDQEKHWPTVVELWKRLEKSGALEKRSYTGLYCSGCERFMTKRDLDEEGNCPNHQVAPEEVVEENWFLKMSEYQDDLKNLLTDTWDGESYRIVPSFREKETLSLIDQGLEDVSFSRPKSSLSWGVPVPGDEDQTMYVWCDALTNYASGVGMLTDKAEPEWWDDATITHVIGKDIARFHALIWPLMLKLGEVRTPDYLLIHGFLTSEGEKMSKSLGNVVQPNDVLEKFDGNPDPIRFYLSSEIPVGRDGDFSWQRFEELYNAKLRNQLGNLLNRVITLLGREGGQLGTISDHDFTTTWAEYEKNMNAHELHKGIEQAIAFAYEGNLAMDKLKPWTLEGQEKVDTLSSICEFLRHAALMMLPFMPATAQRISIQLGVPYAKNMLDREFVITDKLKAWGGVEGWSAIGEPEILFAPLETEE